MKSRSSSFSGVESQDVAVLDPGEELLDAGDAAACWARAPAATSGDEGGDGTGVKTVLYPRKAMRCNVQPDVSGAIAAVTT